MHDLDERLERLAAGATRDAAPPGGGGRGRGRPGPPGPPGGSLWRPARPDHGWVDRPDVTGAANFGGYWFGKADASVFLRQGVTPAERAAVRRRLQALRVVDRVFYESGSDAYARLKVQFRSQPDVFVSPHLVPSALPESFRVRLDAPEHYQRLQQALCPGAPRNPAGAAACMAGVDGVVEFRARLEPHLVPKPWPATSDATVLLPSGAGAQPRAVQAQLEAIDGVAKVTYQSPKEMSRRLPGGLRTIVRNGGLVLWTEGSPPAAFRVTLDDPARVREFHLALCGSRTTGECPGGLVVLEHPRR